MRIGIGRFWTETSSFNPVLTTLEMMEAYGILRGQAVLGDATIGSSIPGFLDVAGSQELVGVLSAWVKPAGYLTEHARDTLLHWFMEDLKKALPLDGLLLNLHGAIAALGEPDFEGRVLEAARSIVGDRVPIAAVLDMHGNITRRKVENADAICGYHTHPHVDFRTTGQRAGRLLVKALEAKARPVMRAVKVPMNPFLERNLTEVYPMKALMDEIRRQLADPRVLDASIFAVQTYLDIPEMGWCSVVITDGDAPLAEDLARHLAQMAWDQRDAYNERRPTYVEALDTAFASDKRPVVVADFADLTGGGGTGDSTWYLKELLSRRPAEPCYLAMVDKEAVARMTAAGQGATVTLSLGGKLDHVYSSPVEVTGQVLRLLPVMPRRALPEWMGDVAVLQAGNVFVVVCEYPGHGHLSSTYRDAGLDPAQAKILVAKSVVDFREGFADVGQMFLMGEAPGLAPSNLHLLKWQNINRPIFPLDEKMVWNSADAAVYAGHTRT